MSKLPDTITAYPPDLHEMPRQAFKALRARDERDSGGLSKGQLREMLYYMALTRFLEELLVALHRQNLVVSGVYRSLGQEAVAVGCAYAMRPADYIQPLIRDLGAALVHGVKPEAILRQYMAKAAGPSAGRDVNLHFSSPADGFVGPVSMLGLGVAVTAGCLLAARHAQADKAGLVFMGDGGSSTGSFYEGVNFAAVQRLPLVVVIEANQYAYSTPTAAQLPAGDLLCRARGFGVMVYDIDGNDVLACYQATALARARGLAGHGVSLVLAHTYRRKGHAEHDNQSYLAAPDEPASWAKHNDPLERFIAHLTHGQHLTEDAVKATLTAVHEALRAARQEVEPEPLAQAESQPYGVYAGEPNLLPAVETWLGRGARR